MPHPWERREDESAKAYHAFGIYRDLDPSERSRDAAYALYAGHDNGTKAAPGYFTRWVQEYEWTARAEAFDAHRERERLAERGTEEIEAFRERQQRLAAAATEAARVLLIKATRRLSKIGEDEITPGMLPSYFRAAAAIAEASTNAEATAIGVEALLRELTESDDG